MDGTLVFLGEANDGFEMVASAFGVWWCEVGVASALARVCLVWHGAGMGCAYRGCYFSEHHDLNFVCPILSSGGSRCLKSI